MVLASLTFLPGVSAKNSEGQRENDFSSPAAEAVLVMLRVSGGKYQKPLDSPRHRGTRMQCPQELQAGAQPSCRRGCSWEAESICLPEGPLGLSCFLLSAPQKAEDGEAQPAAPSVAVPATSMPQRLSLPPPGTQTLSGPVLNPGSTPAQPSRPQVSHLTVSTHMERALLREGGMD